MKDYENPIKNKKGGWGSDEKAKGFTQRGIPEQDPFHANEGNASESTPAERSENTQREDKGS